jgi:hypothetical protein
MSEKDYGHDKPLRFVLEGRIEGGQIVIENLAMDDKKAQRTNPEELRFVDSVELQFSRFWNEKEQRFMTCYPCGPGWPCCF